MSRLRKICVATGTRAEYGILFSLMNEILQDPDLELQLIVTGAHLSAEFGLTHRQIEHDGFVIDAKVEMLLSADTPSAIVKSMGLGVIGFAEVLDRLRPDIIVIAGDRYEMLAMAQAALIFQVPIAHIHGGEVTEGAYDDAIRHAITKMAQWHFVAANPYRQRVIQMGEQPERVFNFGAPGLDHLAGITWLDRDALETALQIELQSPLLLVTYHPVTLSEFAPEGAMLELFEALREYPEATIILTYPNADTGGRSLIELIDQFVREAPASRRAFVSLGQQKYLSLMRQADVVVGNSSSGLTEAPALQKATVNIGDRQKGRLKAESVVDAVETAASIAQAIRCALRPAFRATLSNTNSVYGQGEVGRKIKNALKTVVPMVRKEFFDIAIKD